jgi:hypothetical protein
VSANLWPSLTDRYAAADEYVEAGLQVSPHEVSERIAVELRNAFAAGAMWQYNRSEAGTRPSNPAEATRELEACLTDLVRVEALPTRGIVVVRLSGTRFVEAQWVQEDSEPWSVGAYWDCDPFDDDGTTVRHATAKDAADGMRNLIKDIGA